MATVDYTSSTQGCLLEKDLSPQPDNGSLLVNRLLLLMRQESTPAIERDINTIWELLTLPDGGYFDAMKS
jgi:hypothetical protein